MTLAIQIVVAKHLLTMVKLLVNMLRHLVQDQQPQLPLQPPQLLPQLLPPQLPPQRPLVTRVQIVPQMGLATYVAVTVAHGRCTAHAQIQLAVQRFAVIVTHAIAASGQHMPGCLANRLKLVH